MLKSQIMTTTLEVIYENGIFKPLSGVPETVKEHERMKIVIETGQKPQMTEENFLQMLLAEGLISHIPEGITDDEDDFEPIEIEGEPLSETIIRERR
jgi:predicted DNA-binding antitoxin AbrB/MazE fold protein